MNDKMAGNIRNYIDKKYIKKIFLIVFLIVFLIFISSYSFGFEKKVEDFSDSFNTESTIYTFQEEELKMILIDYLRTKGEVIDVNIRNYVYIYIDEKGYYGDDPDNVRIDVRRIYKTLERKRIN